VDAKDSASGPRPALRTESKAATQPGPGRPQPVRRPGPGASGPGPAASAVPGHRPSAPGWPGPGGDPPIPGHHRRAPRRASRSGSRRHLPTPRV